MEAYAYKYAANPAAGARRIMLCAYSLARSSAVCAARSSAIVRSSYPTVGVAVLEPQGRTLDDLAVLRWLEHGCFLVSESSPLLVLYWQVLFSFLFRRLPPTNWPVYRVACDIFPTYAHPTCSCFLRCLVDAKKWKRHLIADARSRGGTTACRHESLAACMSCNATFSRSLRSRWSRASSNSSRAWRTGPSCWSRWAMAVSLIRAGLVQRSTYRA